MISITPSHSAGRSGSCAADQKEGGRSAETAKAALEADACAAEGAFFEERPIKVMPWGTRRGEKILGEDFGVGGPVRTRFGNLDESARSVSEGWRSGC